MLATSLRGIVSLSMLLAVLFTPKMHTLWLEMSLYGSFICTSSRSAHSRSIFHSLELEFQSCLLAQLPYDVSLVIFPAMNPSVESWKNVTPDTCYSSLACSTALWQCWKTRDTPVLLSTAFWMLASLSSTQYVTNKSHTRSRLVRKHRYYLLH